MHSQLELLITLHDLDLMLNEVAEAGAEVETLGFQAPKIEDLHENREEIIRQLDIEILMRYEQLHERYGRPIVPVTQGICHGCFTSLPTARAAANTNNEQLESCENCGRFLYWLS